MEINLENQYPANSNGNLNLIPLQSLSSCTAANLEKLTNLRMATSKITPSSEFIKDKFSARFAKNRENGQKSVCTEKESSLSKLQNLIKQQKSRQNTSIHTPPEKKDFNRASVDHSRPNELKKLLSLIGTQGKNSIRSQNESQEPLSATKLRLQNFFGLVNGSSTKLPAKPLSSGFGNILVPSVLGNTKYQDNIQNIRRNQMTQKSETDNRNSNVINYKSEKAEPESALLLGSQFQSVFKKPTPNLACAEKVQGLNFQSSNSHQIMNESINFLGFKKTDKQISKCPESDLSVLSPVSSILSAKPSVNCNQKAEIENSRKMQQLNMNDLQLMLANYSSSIGIKNSSQNSKEIISKSKKHDKENIDVNEPKVLGKRKRKTEREIKILRAELKKNVMWTRESIKIMRNAYSGDFNMSEQQIYKWWWDQTRKRTKKTETKLDEEPLSPDMLVSFQDEFGGYSSRLRLNNKKQKVEVDPDFDSGNMELNLCALLNIDVEAIAYRIAMGLDDDMESQKNIEKRNTSASSHESNGQIETTSSVRHNENMKLDCLMDMKTDFQSPEQAHRKLSSNTESGNKLKDKEEIVSTQESQL